ncbi:hypothetical protein PF003_g12673 [Phytophthora fragariae]|nr:hypothetical protein PF003_g12673 [Phytophthora fragariae]
MCAVGQQVLLLSQRCGRVCSGVELGRRNQRVLAWRAQEHIVRAFVDSSWCEVQGASCSRELLLKVVKSATTGTLVVAM